ncbi:MAG: hypothetical protein KDA27_14765 [Candidatus Eisenbacteria bacterium]|uniref:DUF5666 domain-containing protein n=1 Tax=Eiseniibacteriota bacterium TaxID=2212470 RepID=A0A956NHH2_UNCEI|nr:hypothetical protein [Candidatus Eisenbacteria bacterium]
MKLVSLLSLLFFATVVAAQTPQGTGLTYQGRLDKSGSPFDGTAHLRFRLFEDDLATTQVGGDVVLFDVPLAAGLFSVDLDFGAVFDGYARWIEVAVITDGDADWNPLPLQPLQSAPYAAYALSGPGGGTSPWNQGTFGVDYPGNVGVGVPAQPDQGLAVSTGSTDGNTAVFTNDNPNYATLATGNSAFDGIGFYDNISGRHYIGGRLGVGNVAPFDHSKIDVVGSGQGVRSVTAGSIFNSQFNAAMLAIGQTGPSPFFVPAMGLYASSTDDRAVWGVSTNSWGVTGENSAAGTYGILGTQLEAVFGFSPNAAVPAARFTNSGPNGVAIEANGMVKVRTLQITGGADLAERFPVSGPIEPGNVVSIDPSSPGRLRLTTEAYDPRVAGVASGANDLAAGIVLSDGDDPTNTAAIAMSGRVWVRADARATPIVVGDLLTSSDLAGHAQVASDDALRDGAVLGKAMSALETGTGLVLVLVTLR